MELPINTFRSGQCVAWRYWPRSRPCRPIWVEAEVVQFGSLRTRIRVRTHSGNALLRWVHPKNLRIKTPNEALSLFPLEGQTTTSG
jgi:hypothetical protein